ncbi:HYD1 signature containing ADP-ribosyltransferase family protein [Streptomyces tsukubensis]
MPPRGRPLGRRFPGTLLRTTVVGLSLALTGTFVNAVAQADDRGRERPGVQKYGDPLEGKDGKALPRPVDRTKKAAVTRLDRAVWPAGGSTELSVASSGKPTRTAVGGLPVTVTAVAPAKAARTAVRTPAAPDSVRVDVLPTRRASDLGAGALLRVQRADSAAATAPVRLTVDYSAFAEGFGGSYGARLRLVQLPACAVVAEPGSKACPALPVPLPTVNDVEARTASAVVTAAAADPSGPATMSATNAAPLVALAPGNSSSQGNFGATSLAPAAKWSVSRPNGAFSWSYPMRTVPVPGSLAPEVGLSYSSQSTDGKTSTTNNQGSWVGEGFGYEPGYIERRYKPCAEDGQEKSAEQCWAFDNATLMLNGNASQIIKDDTTGGWKLTSPDGSKVEKLNDAVNGDNDGEHWRITTPDSKQYYFGKNRLPGWSAGKEETASTWTAPVFGDDKGEFCYDADFSKAHCKQAWRWNLDYVKDAHGNVMSYFYGKETNHYALNGKTDVNGTAYDRGGYLKRIDYGQRDGQAYAAPAPARVVFGTAERCLPESGFDCAESKRTVANATRWPDVPVDRECKAGTKCGADQSAVSFFTTKRLTSVITQMRKNATEYQDVDAWTLTHHLLDNGDDSKALWLSKIDHEGRVGTPVSMPSLELYGEQLDNRVDIDGDNLAPLKRFRLTTVLGETGSQLDVNYAPAECTVPTLPEPGKSTKRCYPVKWSAPGHTEPIDDWFHKYVVAETIQTDRTGGGEKMVSRYSYQGPAGWRHAKPDGITPEKFLTWGEWQGYGKVTVTSGSESSQRTRIDYTYFQGLNGDKVPGGGTRTVRVSDSTGASYPDDEDYVGFELEAITYNGAAVVGKVINQPWKHHTATQTMDWGTLRATLVESAVTRGFTALASGDWRETRSSAVYDTATGTGRITRAEDLGLVVPDSASDAEKAAAAKDDTCTRTWYADSTASERNFLSSVQRVEKVATACDAAVDRKKQVVSDTRTVYDGLAQGAAPTHGLPTSTERLASHNGTTATYESTGSYTYDGYGRPTVSDTPATGKSTTTYTTANGLTTSAKVVNSARHAVTTDFEPAWGQSRGQTDASGYRTDLAFDALGRVTSVWLPDRAKTQTPSTKYGYTVRRDGVVAVKREIVEENGSYSADYTLYDSLLRPRQRQAPGPGGTRLVADTMYDSRGSLAVSYDTYQAAGAASDTLLTVRRGEVPTQTYHEYDDMGRGTATALAVGGVEQWRTTTLHEGDRTHLIPPRGGIAKTSLTDAAGRTTELRQYQSGAPGTAGPVAFTSTKYSYTPAGAPETVTDEMGNVWSFAYDQQGRRVKAVDPDAGTTLTEYDTADRITKVTHEGRGTSVRTTYDSLSRPLFTYDKDDKKLTEQRYDRAGAIGRPYASLRYTSDTEFFATVVQTSDRFYRPLRTAYSVPAGQGKLAGTYTFTNTYNRDGTLQGTGLPAVGGLPAEGLVYGYDELQRPTSLQGTDSYVSNTVWSPTSDLLQYEQNTGGKKVWNTFEYETGTKRISRALVDIAGTTGGPVKRTGYSYDQAGNVLSMADTGAGAAADVQCFRYDENRRLSEAWTPAADIIAAEGTGTVGTTAPVDGTAPSACTADPGTTPLGGPAAYWKSYRTDAIGNRTSDITHDTSLDATKDITRTFTYGEGAAGPHAVTTVTQKSPTGEQQSRYGYDSSGNTTTRTIGGNTDTLSWGPEGRLAKLSHPDDATTPANEASDTSFVYGADGGRVLRKDAKGTTLYLPGTELHLPTGGTAVEATRYYQHAGATVAVRGNDGKVTLLSSDHHGTGDVAVDAATGAVNKRRFDPYGNARGAAPASWPGSKGFVGGTIDESTGLTNLGAREYDPRLGKFISVDPIIDFANAQQMNGYAYANNSPVTFSDPSGLLPAECGLGEIKCSPNGKGGFKTEKKKKTNPNTEKKSTRTSKAESDRNRAEGHVIVAEAAMTEVIDTMIYEVKEIAGINAVEDCLSNPALGTCLKAAAEIALLFVGSGLKFIAKAKNVGKVLNLLPDLRNAIGKVGDAEKRRDKAEDKLEDARKQDEDNGDTCETNSFLPDALVQMADGTRKKIKDVKPGDKILTTDPRTGKNEVREVAGTIVTEDDKDFVDLTVVSAKGSATLTSTVGHRFWVPAENRWIEAGDLRPGTELHTPQGDPVALKSLRHFEQRQRTHDLTISGIHAYYVLAGAKPVLVHNSDECPTTLYHYTNEAGHDGIIGSGELRPSLKASNPKDARYGDGQYLTDIEPGTKTLGQLSAAFLRVPWAGRKFTHYIEIDVRGLEVVEGRPGVFVIPNRDSLDLTDRIRRSGRN